MDRGSCETPGSIAGRVFHFHLGEGSPPCNLHLARLPACASRGRGSCKAAAVRHGQTERPRNEPGWVGGYGRSQCPKSTDRDQAQAPRSLLEAAVRVTNTFLLPGMEISSRPPAKGSKLQACLAACTDALRTSSSSSTQLSCKRNPAAHPGASPIFRDELGSKSQ